MASEKRTSKRRSFFKDAIAHCMPMGAILVAVACLPSIGFTQDYRYNPEHRRPVEATLRDLQGVAEYNTSSGKERERYDNAINHLTQFADRLHERGVFDKGKLDQAIDDLHNVVDHNRMGERAHDILSRDLTDLRRLREHWDERNYRYGDRDRDRDR